MKIILTGNKKTRTIANNKHYEQFNSSFFSPIKNYNMKQSLSILLIVVLAFSACKNDQSKSIDLNALQKSMDADQDVATLRALLYAQTRLLASIPPADLEKIFSKSHECGLYGSTASTVELEKCLRELPFAAAYVESQQHLKSYESQYEVVERRFPDFAQLDYKKQAELLVPVNEAEAQKVLSDYLSKSKK